MKYNSKILATGSYLPKKILTNQDLEKMVDTSNDWIIERTGIKERRIASSAEGETPSEMAAIAARKALADAKLQPNDIDFIIFNTCTGDYLLPSTSALLQQKLGITNECPCVDLAAACTGFIYGLVFADSLIKTGAYKNILVIGSDMLSAYTNWQDRNTCVLFADGAGVALVGRSEGEESSLRSSVLGCDGSGAELLKIPAGGSKEPATQETVAQARGTITMEGKQVFKYATRTMMRNAKIALEQANLRPDQLDWLIPHQANLRIIEYLSQKLEIPLNKVVVTVEEYGNNSAATIPIAFDKAIRDGRIRRGQTVGMVAFGAGVTSGAVVINY